MNMNLADFPWMVMMLLMMMTMMMIMMRMMMMMMMMLVMFCGLLCTHTEAAAAPTAYHPRDPGMTAASG